MTTVQFLILIGTIYIAPHTSATLGLFMGMAFITFAACMGLGLIP